MDRTITASELADKIAKEMEILFKPLSRKGKLFGIGQGYDKDGNVILDIYNVPVCVGGDPNGMIIIYFNNDKALNNVSVDVKCEKCFDRIGRNKLFYRVESADIKEISLGILNHLHKHNIRLTMSRHRKYHFAESHGFSVILP